MTQDRSKDREDRLQAILHQYLQAVDAGQASDAQAIVQRHPEFATELNAFFADQAQLARMAASMRPAVPLGDAPTTGVPSAGATAGPKPIDVIRYFGDYELLEEIARGGMGVVYKARQVKLKRTVAVKMILAGELAGANDVNRFYTEAQAAANLHHANIVAIHEVGQHNGQHYFSMDYVDGESLNSRIARGPLPVREAAGILRKVARAVSFAHVAGVIHRDLKPANILLDAKGEPHVTDFGLAKQVSGGMVSGESSGPPLTTHHSPLTVSGQVLGTPSYMPPEQASGKTKEIGPRADVYSLGAVLYSALTGRPPFQAASVLDTLLQVLELEPIPPRQMNHVVPRDLETICLKCLEKDPQRRYASAQELADELDRFVEGRPIHARPVGPVGRTWRWCRRKPAVAGLTAAVAMSLVIGISISTYFALVADARAHDAEVNAANAKNEKTRAETNAEQAKKSAEHALLEKDRADREAEQAQDILSRSLYEQAQALRRSTQPGRRSQSLTLLQEAEKLRSRTRKVDIGPAPPRGAGLSAQLPTQLELRNEAVAAIFTPDAGLVRELQLGTTGSRPTVSIDGRLAAGLRMKVDFAKMAKGDPGGSDFGVEVVDLADIDKTVRWQPSVAATLGMMAPMAISADNRLVASSTQKTLGPKKLLLQIELRDLWQGNVVRVLDWPSDEKSEPADALRFAHCYFSPDGRFLAATQMGIARIELAVWDLKTGSARNLTRDGGPAHHWVVFTSDSKRLAYQGGEKTIMLWDLDKAEVAETIQLPLPILHPPALGDKDQLLAAPCKGPADSKLTILVWDLRNKVEKTRFVMRGTGFAGIGLIGLAFRPGTTQLAMGEGANIVVRDIDDGKEIARIDAGHKPGVALLSWQRGGQRLVSASLDGSLKLWEVLATSPLVSIQPAAPGMSRVAFSPDGSWLAGAAGQSLQAFLIDPKDGAVKRTFATTIKNLDKPAPLGFHHVYFRSDGKQLAAISAAGKAAVWDVASGKEVARLDTKDLIFSGAFSDQGHFLVRLDHVEKIVVWDVHDARPFWETSAQGRTIGYLQAQGRRLVEIHSGEPYFDKYQLSIWDIPRGKQTGPFPMEGITFGPVISPDGQLMSAHLMSVDSGNAKVRGLAVWQLATGKKLLDIDVDPVNQAFSADGRLLGIVASDGVVSLWDTRAGREVLRGAFDASDIAFSPDGKTLALRGIDAATGGATAKIHMLDLAELRARLSKLGLDW